MCSLKLIRRRSLIKMTTSGRAGVSALGSVIDCLRASAAIHAGRRDAVGEALSVCIITNNTSLKDILAGSLKNVNWFVVLTRAASTPS